MRGATPGLMPYDGLLDVAPRGRHLGRPVHGRAGPLAKGARSGPTCASTPSSSSPVTPATTRAFHLAFQKFRGWTNSRAGCLHEGRTAPPLAPSSAGWPRPISCTRRPWPACRPPRILCVPPYLPGAEEQKRGLVVWRAVPFEDHQGPGTRRRPSPRPWAACPCSPPLANMRRPLSSCTACADLRGGPRSCPAP